MKRILIASILAAATSAVFSLPANAANVGVAISIGEPGFYGQLDIGGYPPPQVIYRQPVMVQPVPVNRPPIYLRVPPGYARHWARHCREYNACGERVFFVNDDWYRREYAPRYQEQHRDRREDRREERRDDRRDDHRRGDDHRDYGRDH